MDVLFCPRPPTSSHSVVVNSECASARSPLRAWLCGDKWALLTALLWRLPSAEQTLVTCEYLIIASVLRAFFARMMTLKQGGVDLVLCPG